MNYVILCKEHEWETSAFILGFFKTKDDVSRALSTTFYRLEKDKNNHQWWFDDLSFKTLPKNTVLLRGNINDKWNDFSIAIFKMDEINE